MPVSDRLSRQIARWTILLTGIVLALPLAGHALVGWSSRYMADDYCTAGTLRVLGFWPSQAFWYSTWSGRYSYTFVVSLVQALGVGVARILPGLSIAGWVCMLALCLYLLGRRIGTPMWTIGAVVAGTGVVFVVLDGTPNVYQSVYWLTGMITYVLPLILLAALSAWLLLRGDRGSAAVSPVACLAVGLASLIIGGFSETTGVLQVSILAVALAVVLAVGGPHRSIALALLGSALLGASLALLLMVFAPGTQIRRDLVSEPVTLKQLATRLIQDGRIFLARTARKVPAGLGLAVILPAALALGWQGVESSAAGFPQGQRRRLLAAIVLLPPLVGGLMLATMAPYEFAVADYPDARLLVTSLFVLVAGLSMWGFLLGTAVARFAPRHTRPAGMALGVAAVFLALAAAIPGTQRVGLRLPDVQSFAAGWEARDQALRMAAARGIEQTAAASLPHMGGLAEIGYDPDEWVNRCVAQTYGLKRVIAK